jgi:hypothetical protein
LAVAYELGLSKRSMVLLKILNAGIVVCVLQNLGSRYARLE